MIRISKLADYAVVILGFMSQGKVVEGVDVDNPRALESAASLAQRSLLPEPTVSKVLKLLAAAGIVSSVRGAQGGYYLASAPHEIDMAAIIRAVDGPVSLTACVEGSTESCSYAASCPVNGRWNLVNDAVAEALQSVSLADMIAPARSRKSAQCGHTGFAEKIHEMREKTIEFQEEKRV
jgi:FeS assembly SUF system regulator